ncbi:MAG: CHAP domain-containing protein, partial [Clostridia bacterium]|nr:CHAP domain-containing protein [Clostridia bacterium]
MENNLQMMMKKQKRRKIWLSTLGIMMCIVVFCTTYALILPAITMEPDTWCGKEEHKHEDTCFKEEMICQSHTHGDECYARQSELICAKEEEAGHLHTDACAPLTELILSCGMEESAGHTHTEECEPKTEKNLVCEQEEGEAHTHSEPCYTTIITYGCGLPETEGHTHDDTCYTLVTTYGCGLEETAGHTHGEECYSETTVLTCELEAEEHEHSEACYENQLTCELEEHTHSLACYSDPTADVETAANWEATLPDELTGVYAQDVLAIAESQLGYTESIRNYIVSGSGEMQGYTRYGEWYGNPYGDWCAMFASFCLHYAGVEDFPLEASCSKWVADLTEKELYREAVAYEPQPGDLVFFNQDEDEAVDHVGIVVEMIPADGENPAKLRTIEGNSGNRVCEIIYELSTPEEWEKILGYGDINTAYKLAKEKQKLDNPVIQEYLCEIPDHTHSADCLQQEETEYEKLLLETTYENDRLSAVIRVEGIMPLPGEIQGESQKEDNIGGENNQKNEISDSFAAQENDPEVPLETEDESVSDDMTAEDKNETEIESGASNQEPILVVEELDSKNETYQNIAGVDHEGELVDLTVLQIQIQNGDQSIELDDCTITAEIVPSKALMTEILDVCDQMEAHAVEEVETGVHLTALNDEGEETTPGVLVTSQTREAPVMMTRVANNGV